MMDANEDLLSTTGPMRLLYFLALIAIVLPPCRSGWVGLVTGSGWPRGALLEHYMATVPERAQIALIANSINRHASNDEFGSIA